MSQGRPRRRAAERPLKEIGPPPDGVAVPRRRDEELQRLRTVDGRAVDGIEDGEGDGMNEGSDEGCDVVGCGEIEGAGVG